MREVSSCSRRLPGAWPGSDAVVSLNRLAHVVSLPAGRVVYHEGDACEYYLAVNAGVIRVQKVTHDGHELVLYRIGPGQTCRLTNACLLGGQCYPAHAVVERDAVVLYLPKMRFRDIFEQSPEFRQWVFCSIEHGMHDWVGSIEALVHNPMERRLACLLFERAGAESMLRVTHYDLARELGTAREVVSRLLKGFEHHGWIKLHRGAIEILDSRSLACLGSDSLCDISH